MDMVFVGFPCCPISRHFVWSSIRLFWLGILLKFKLVGADIRLLYIRFAAVLSLDDIDASEDIEVVDIFDRYGFEPWLTPRVAEDSVISDEVEEEDDNGRGYMDPLSCMLCNAI